MQGVCRLSRRWHQQFCHSPSFGPHWQCVRTLIPIRELRQARRLPKLQRGLPVNTALSSIENFHPADDWNPFSPSRLLSKEGDDLVVQEFEQVGSDTTTRKKIEPNKELNDEIGELWDELQDVEKQLEIARQGPFGPQSDFMKQLPGEQREDLLKALAEEGIAPQDEEDALDLAEIDRLMDEDREVTEEEDMLEITLHIPKAHRALVTHFNKALSEAKASEGDTMKNLNLWKWYLRSQQKIPGFSRIVSEGVWDFLWMSQSQLRVRPQHLVLLGADMLAAGQSMSQEQLLQYIQALHNHQDPAEALRVWEEMRPQLDSESTAAFLSDFYSTGIQLYAAVGRPQKAQNIAFSGLEKGANASILAHAVSAWARDKTQEAAVKAWAVYLRMRAMMGDGMTQDLYERISDDLLDTKHSSLALAVFKDMIVGMGGSASDTLATYQKALGNLKSKDDPEEVEKAINQVSLTMLLALPKQYQNKFFFASWIKKLLGQQRIEAASMVLDLMYERNIKPDAIHINGIIGAWLRDRSPQARERAVKLASEMIQSKVNQVSQHTENASLRRIGFAFRKVMPLNENNNVWSNPIRQERPIPAANAETFSLLFEYHEQRRQWREFQSLTQTMIGPAQLKPNTFIMNKWLAAELQARSSGRFWTLFNGLKGEIRPNLETFSLAWQAVLAPLSIFKSQDSTSHRQLFADQTEWAQSLRSRQRRDVKDEFNPHLYSEIIRSFCYQLDLPGTVCAMQGLHDAFGATPDDVSIRLITGQIARLLPRSDPTMPAVRGRRRGNARFTEDQTTLKHIAEIIETLEAQMKMERVESEDATPEELEDQDSAAAKKLQLDVMTEFLVMMMQKMKGEGEDPAQALADAAETMKVDISRVKLYENVS